MLNKCSKVVLLAAVANAPWGILTAWAMDGDAPQHAMGMEAIWQDEEKSISPRVRGAIPKGKSTEATDMAKEKVFILAEVQEPRCPNWHRERDVTLCARMSMLLFKVGANCDSNRCVTQCHDVLKYCCHQQPEDWVAALKEAVGTEIEATSTLKVEEVNQVTSQAMAFIQEIIPNAKAYCNGKL